MVTRKSVTRARSCHVSVDNLIGIDTDGKQRHHFCWQPRDASSYLRNGVRYLVLRDGIRASVVVHR